MLPVVGKIAQEYTTDNCNPIQGKVWKAYVGMHPENLEESDDELEAVQDG